MPAYPFIALFLAQYALYITEYRTKVTRVFAAFLASVVSVVMNGLLPDVQENKYQDSLRYDSLNILD